MRSNLNPVRNSLFNFIRRISLLNLLSKRNRKFKKTVEQLMAIGMEAFTSTNLSLEERSTLIWEIEEDLNQFPGEALSVKKKLIQSACLKIATDYPDFKK